jgi:hypothetical protein
LSNLDCSPDAIPVFSNIDSNENTATGTEALLSNTTGGFDTAIGQGALVSSPSAALTQP